MNRVALVAAAALVSACSGGSGHPTASPTAPVVVVQQTLGPHDVPLPAVDHRTGHFSVRLLDGRCGITYLTGTHAEFELHDPACRIHERIVSLDADYHSISTTQQRLVLSTGALVAPSRDAMRIKRQPEQILVGAHDAIEINLYFEVPPGAVPRAVRVVGDGDPGISVQPPGPRTVDIPIPELAG